MYINNDFQVIWELNKQPKSTRDFCYIDGLQTNAVSARAGDPLLTLTGGSAGVRSAGALEITGVTSGTEAVFPTSVATGQLQPSPSTNAYMRIFTG